MANVVCVPTTWSSTRRGEIDAGAGLYNILSSRAGSAQYTMPDAADCWHVPGGWMDRELDSASRPGRSWDPGWCGLGGRSTVQDGIVYLVDVVS